MIRKFLLVLAFFAIFRQMYAEPGQVHLSWSDGKNDKLSSITMMWTSNSVQNQEYLLYGKDTTHLTKVKAKKTIDGSKAFYTISLNNLPPSTLYFYRCGSDQTGWTENNEFKTAPETGKKTKFTVGVWGDTQNNKNNEHLEKTKPIVEKLARLKPDFTLHMGDIVNNGAITTDWLDFLTIAQPLNTIAPMMPTLGNHDVQNTKESNYQKPYPSFYQLFSLPRDGLDYSFDYGNTHFICLYSGLVKSPSESSLIRYKPGSEEYLWLEKDLAKARSNPDTDWIIAYTHYPLFSAGRNNVQQWEYMFSPLFDKYRVDLCLSGHRHFYVRHSPIYSGLQAQDGKGTVYITNGTSGGSPQSKGGEKWPAIAFSPDEKMYNYALMTIDGKNLKYEVFDQDGQKMDVFILTK
ncbi:MAG: metallophosphoesterase family protein [Bacteroidales bacterium]|nr:metallophosphoesterase family protein [Bacteroidales bacterium]